MCARIMMVGSGPRGVSERARRKRARSGRLAHGAVPSRSAGRREAHRVRGSGRARDTSTLAQRMIAVARRRLRSPDGVTVHVGDSRT